MPIHTRITSIARLQLHYIPSSGPDIEFSFRSAACSIHIMKLVMSIVRDWNNGAAKVMAPFISLFFFCWLRNPRQILGEQGSPTLRFPARGCFNHTLSSVAGSVSRMCGTPHGCIGRKKTTGAATVSKQKRFYMTVQFQPNSVEFNMKCLPANCCALKVYFPLYVNPRLPQLFTKLIISFGFWIILASLVFCNASDMLDLILHIIYARFELEYLKSPH